ncbi:MAG: hypothetical protein ACREKS_23730, partial [Candidatus Rokuibacteriota bacterium]
MRGRLRAAWLLVALSVSAAEAGLADRIGATFSFMSAEFVKAFEPQEGVVVAVEGDTVFLDLGEQSGVQVGREFVVFRKGDPFRHPITGKVIGRYETVLGHAQVRSVSGEFSEALFVAGRDRPGPRPEDSVRISRGRIKVAITPLLDLTGGTADVRRVPYLFASVLDRTKRFQVVDPFAVTDMFASGGTRVEEVLARPARAVHVGKNLDVAGWLVPVLMERRGTVFLDVTYISAITG